MMMYVTIVVVAICHSYYSRKLLLLTKLEDGGRINWNVKLYGLVQRVHEQIL